MPWIQLGVAAVGMLAGRSAKKKQQKAAAAQQATADAQLQLSKDQQAFARKQYDDWYGTFFPLAGEAVSEARKDVRPDFERIAGDVRGQYEGQRGAMIRTAQRYGMNPADGAFSDNLAQLGNDEAKTHVLARNRARQDSKGQKLNNMMAAYGMGSGMPGLSAQTMAQSGASLGAAGAGYGNAAAAHGQNAADASYGVSNALGSIPWGQFLNRGGGGANSSAGPYSGGYQMPNGGSNSTNGPWSSGYVAPQSPWINSSRELKYGISKINPEDALDVVMNTPVRGYKYKGSTEPFIGTIAEDAPREISDGKRVNLVNQVGSLTGAVQAITQQLRGATNMAKPASAMSKPGGRQQRQRGGRDKEY